MAGEDLVRFLTRLSEEPELRDAFIEDPIGVMNKKRKCRNQLESC